MTQPRTLRNFIGGEYVDATGDASIDLVNPATGQVVAHAPVSTQADVDDEATLDDLDDGAGDDAVLLLDLLDVAPGALVLGALLGEDQAAFLVLLGEDEGLDAVADLDDLLCLDDAHAPGHRGGDDDAAPVLRRQARDLATLNGDKRLGLKGLFHGLRETVPVHGQGATRRNLARVAAAHDDRSALAQFVVQQADGRRLVIIRAEGIGTDQFGEAAGLVGVGAADRAHLVQHDRHAGTGDLPSGFRPGEAAANDVDGINLAHGRRLKAGPTSPQVPEIMQGVQITAWRAGARLETATGCDYT